MQRQVIRTRFMLSRNPRFVTTIIIAINVAIYLILVGLLGLFGSSHGIHI